MATTRYIWLLDPINRFYVTLGLPEPYPEWFEQTDNERDICMKEESFGPFYIRNAFEELTAGMQGDDDIDSDDDNPTFPDGRTARPVPARAGSSPTPPPFAPPSHRPEPRAPLGPNSAPEMSTPPPAGNDQGTPAIDDLAPYISSYGEKSRP